MQSVDLVLVWHRYVDVQSGKSYHMKATMVRQSARSLYTCNEATVGASISRHDLSIQQVMFVTSFVDVVCWLIYSIIKCSKGPAHLCNPL